MKIDSDNYFSIGRAIYWHSVLNHSGMFSELYEAQSIIEYRPAMSEGEPCGDSDSDCYEDWEVYSEIKTYSPKKVLMLAKNLVKYMTERDD